MFEIQNGDALVVFVDHGFTRPLIRGFVNLDYEASKVADPKNPGAQVQMIGESRVSGIPTNIDADTWREVFSEGRPAVLFRAKDRQLNVA